MYTFKNTGLLRLNWHVAFFLAFFLFFNLSQAQPPDMLPDAGGGSIQIDPKSLNSSQLSNLLKDNNKDAGVDQNALLLENETVIKDSTAVDNIKAGELTKMSTFGENVFSGGPTMSISELSTPPLDYPIGVGDNIIVAMWGGAEMQQSYVVGRDGSIFPNSLGKIMIQGLKFETAREIIRRRFLSVVPVGTNITVTMGQPRTINVNVGGNARKPGQVTISAFSNAFNVIALAGGTNAYADLRNILIKRNGVTIDSIDIYKYLTTGDYGSQIYLENNDFILIGDVQKKVLATGQFKRPMYYQLKSYEGVKALLKYSGGLTPDALASNMQIIRSEAENQTLNNINANAILKLANEDFLLEDGDIVKVDLIKPGIVNKVELRGEVKYPGIYEIRNNDRLFDVINRAGGVTKNTFLGRAYIFRGAGDSTNLRSDKLDINLEDINTSQGDTSEFNIKLYANDIIQLFSSNEFADVQYVEIFGEVRKQGRVRKYGGMTLEDLLILAGGLKQTAEFGRLEISSVVDPDSARRGLQPTRTIVNTYAISGDLLIDSTAGTIRLRPFDQVYVRKNPSFELQELVDIRGLVKYPGLYPRLSKYEKLSSFIKRSGGIMENANLAGAVMFRRQRNIMEQKPITKPVSDSLFAVLPDSLAKGLKLPKNEPITIELYKALKNPNSKHDIILQDGDILVIPEIDPFVSVKGQVQSPLKLAFDKEHTRVGYYIDKAGGFSEKPWRSRIHVTYANGKSRRTRSILFFKFYPRVEEGSVVNVPRKPESQGVVDVLKGTILTAIPLVLMRFILKGI